MATVKLLPDDHQKIDFLIEEVQHLQGHIAYLVDRMLLMDAALRRAHGELAWLDAMLQEVYPHWYEKPGNSQPGDDED